MLDGAVNPSVTGLPVGVSYTIDTTVIPSLLTISGVLDSGNTKDSFNYTVTASGSSGGCTTSVSGVITISREDILVPASNSSQVICEGAAIENIIFEYSGGAIGATVDWTVNSVPSTIPAGLIIGNDNGVLTRIRPAPTYRVVSMFNGAYSPVSTTSLALIIKVCASGSGPGSLF